MNYVVIEFVGDNAPQLVKAALPLSHIALCLCLPLADLIEQTGPTIGSVTVWNARTEELLAIYQPMQSLRQFI